MEDDTVKYSKNENDKYNEIVEDIKNDHNFLSNILNHFGFKDLIKEPIDNQDKTFKYLLGYIPNPDKTYGNSEFIKILTTPILLVAIFIIIAVPQFNNDIEKVELFWIVIILLYVSYTLKHWFFLSKLCMQFNTFLEYNLYKDKFKNFLDDNTGTFFWYLISSNSQENGIFNNFLSFIRVIYVFGTYLIPKIFQIAIIPGLLFLIIYSILGNDNQPNFFNIILPVIFVLKFLWYIYMMWTYKQKIKEYYGINNNPVSTGYNDIYDETYDTYHNPVTSKMKAVHKIFSGGDSAFSSYLFTKTFTLIFGILMFIIGIPIYSIVLSITLLYISLNFIYNIIIFPLIKPETREKIFKIIKENGSLLALLFTGLTINSIYQSHIFGDKNKQIVGIMCAVYAILVIMHIGRKNVRKNNRVET